MLVSFEGVRRGTPSLRCLFGTLLVNQTYWMHLLRVFAVNFSVTPFPLGPFNGHLVEVINLLGLFINHLLDSGHLLDLFIDEPKCLFPQGLNDRLHLEGGPTIEFGLLCFDLLTFALRLRKLAGYFGGGQFFNFVDEIVVDGGDPLLWR